MVNFLGNMSIRRRIAGGVSIILLVLLVTALVMSWRKIPTTPPPKADVDHGHNQPKTGGDAGKSTDTSDQSKNGNDDSAGKTNPSPAPGEALPAAGATEAVAVIKP